MILAAEVKLLKTSCGSFGPEVAEAAGKVMDYLDYILEVDVIGRVSSNRPMFRLPRGYYFDMTSSGYFQLCMPESVESEEQAQQIFARDAATGLLEEICNALDYELAERVRSDLSLERCGPC